RCGRSETRSRLVSSDCWATCWAASTEGGRRLAAHDGADELGAFGSDREPRPLAPLFPGDETRFGQDRQMVAHCGLAAVQRVDQITSADLTFRHRSDDAQQPQPYGVGQHLEVAGQLLGFWR